MTQIPLMLATIIQKYKVEGVNTDQEIKIERDLAIRPGGGSPVMVTRRTEATTDRLSGKMPLDKNNHQEAKQSSVVGG